LNLCLSPYELPFSEGAHQMKWLALAGLLRVLAESDADLVAVLPGSIEQNCEVTIKEGMLNETTLKW
jgi:hypothetical protein